MFNKILLAYDGSEPAKKAFVRCLEMATCFKAQLSIVAVIRPPEFAEDVETEAILETAAADERPATSDAAPARADEGTSKPEGEQG